MARTARITVGGSPMDIYVAEPAKAGPHPVVLYMHHRYGVEDFTHGICDRFAADGFIALAPDLFHRRPAAEEIKTKREAMRDDEALADIGATIDVAAGLAGARRGDIAIHGHCMGGRMALVGASEYRALKAAVVLYGGNMFVPFGKGGPSAFERLHAISCPVAGFYGMKDKNPSPEEVDRIDAELTRHGVPHVFRRYDDAGHGFSHFTLPNLYNAAVAEDAWTKSVAFLNGIFGRPA